MPTNQRITDLTDYSYVLPYASEMFGVYQPMIGWRSRRMARRYGVDRQALLQSFASNYSGVADTSFSKTDCVADIKGIDIGTLALRRLIENDDSVLMQAIAARLPRDRPPAGEQWSEFINPDLLRKLLATDVSQRY